MARAAKLKERGPVDILFILQVVRTTCQEIKAETFTSPKFDKVHTVNRQAVAALLVTGMGYAGLKKFSELMNVPVMHQKTSTKGLCQEVSLLGHMEKKLSTYLCPLVAQEAP